MSLNRANPRRPPFGNAAHRKSSHAHVALPLGRAYRTVKCEVSFEVSRKGEDEEGNPITVVEAERRAYKVTYSGGGAPAVYRRGRKKDPESPDGWAWTPSLRRVPDGSPEYHGVLRAITKDRTNRRASQARALEAAAAMREEEDAKRAMVEAFEAQQASVDLAAIREEARKAAKASSVASRPGRRLSVLAIPALLVVGVVVVLLLTM